MNTAKIYEEFKELPKTRQWVVRKNYFSWKYSIHKPLTIDCRFLSKEEFMELNKIDEKQFRELQLWEKSKIFQHWKFILEMDNFDNNFFNVYEELKSKAIKGDYQSAKELLELHNSMENKFSEEEKKEEEEKGTSKKKRGRKKKSKKEEKPTDEEVKDDDDKPKFDFNI